MRSSSPKSVAGDPIVLSAVAVACVTLGLSAWLLFLRTKPPGPPQPRQLTSFTHLHCPKCKDEIPYNPDKAQADCPECKGGVRYVATMGSIHGDSGNRWHKPLGFGAIVLVVVPAFVHVLVWRTRALRRREQDLLHRRVRMLCPFCDRKVSFPASLAGSGHVCSGCKTAFTLEPDGDPVASDDASHAV